MVGRVKGHCGYQPHTGSISSSDGLQIEGTRNQKSMKYAIKRIRVLANINSTGMK